MRLRATLGIQAKLVIAFSSLLLTAIATSTGVFNQHSREALSDMLGEQARQIAQTLALAAETPYEIGDEQELLRLGQDLLRSRNIVLVVFCDSTNKPLQLACRDPDFTLTRWANSPEFRSDTTQLMQVHRRHLPSLGDFLQITAPVFDTQRDARRSGLTGRTLDTRLLGYLTVGISQNAEQMRLARVGFLSAAIACMIFLLCLPLACTLVHRIFLPIRQLAAAANRIAGGDYDAEVATDRPDEIGDMARAFNEMVHRVRHHRRQLEEANRGLEEKVRQRTAELEDINRRLSAEIAEKEEFLRAVSHDLNAPLRNIGGMASLLLMKHREKFDDEIIHRLERIQKNVEVETGLISELLELSRIKTRRQKMEPINVRELLGDVAGLFEDDLRQRQISLVIDPGPFPTLVCEKARLRQVFQNLIDNAIKYMGDSPLREIHVGCRAGQDHAEFHVRDTGIGIHPDDLPRLFCVFRRGRNSVEMNIAGKGVGLASVKSIVEMYGGRISVQSRLGEGTEFRFSLPMNSSARAENEPSREPTPATA